MSKVLHIPHPYAERSEAQWTSFIGRGNWNTQRKPQTNFITL